MTALSPRRIGLLLLLDALGLGVPKTYDDRRTVQAAVYIAKAAGLDLGYRYGWYVYGPWSPALHDDLAWLASRCAPTSTPTLTTTPATSPRHRGAPMIDLLERIDATPTPQTTLDPSDQAAIERLDRAYRDQLADLERARTTLATLPTDSAWLTAKRDVLQRELEGDHGKARERHQDSIYGHFRNVHGLELRDYDDATRNIPDSDLTQHLLERIQGALGGESLLDRATRALADTLRRRAYRTRLNKRTLTLNSFVYTEDDFGGRRKLSYGSEQELRLLARALGRFQRASTEPAEPLLSALLRTFSRYSPINDEPPFGEPFATQLRRVESLVIFKNGNVRLSFPDEGTAAAFVTFYGLKQAD